MWAGVDNIFEAMRDEPGVVDESVYACLKYEQPLVPEDASDLDWAYRHVSNKLFMVLNAYLDVDPTKIIDESKQQCGFEAYARSAERTTRLTRTRSTRFSATFLLWISGRSRDCRGWSL